MQKDNLPDHAFWRFVTKTQENPLARRSMAQLQQMSAIQTNLLLFCCWFAQAGQGRLAKQDCQDLLTATSFWHDRITLPLQKLQTQATKSLFSDLAEQITHELQFTNHIEQMMLVDVSIKFIRTSRTPIQKLTDACKNIALYCKTAHIFLNTTLCDELFHLLATIFTGIDLLEMQKICQAILLNEAAQPSSQGKLVWD